MFDPVSIDAEYMERWLGGAKIDSLSPKTLFDIRTLITHYRDIIVPESGVKVEFPTEQNEGAKASVDENVIFIPTHLLEDGRIDDTLGCMIHELHHIKLSDSERQTWASCFGMICKCMDSLFVQTGDDEWTSIYDIVLSDGSLTFKTLYSEDTEVTENVMFLRTACRDLAFLLNAVEDVRIDSLASPNLGKYEQKMSTRIFNEHFSPKYNEGEMNENSLFNVAFRLLFQHKGFINDSFIEERFGDKSLILNQTPKEYTPLVFKQFADVIRNHVEDLYKNKRSDFETTMGGVDYMDLYMSEKSMSDAEEHLLNDMSEDDKMALRAKEDSKGIEFEDAEVTDGEVKVSIGKEIAVNLSEQRQKRNKPKLLPATFIAEIEAFKDITVHHTTEHFDASGFKVDFSTIIFDATN